MKSLSKSCLFGRIWTPMEFMYFLRRSISLRRLKCRDFVEFLHPSVQFSSLWCLDIPCNCTHMYLFVRPTPSSQLSNALSDVFGGDTLIENEPFLLVSCGESSFLKFAV